jgi:hypothetical protein
MMMSAFFGKKSHKKKTGDSWIYLHLTVPSVNSRAYVAEHLEKFKNQAQLLQAQICPFVLRSLAFPFINDCAIQSGAYLAITLTSILKLL